MPKGRNQKSKLLYLAKIFREETDDGHALTVQQLIEKLEALDIPANRKTIYDDLEELRRFGLDIIKEQRDRNVYYHLGSREFELAELKLLVDSVQGSRFITAQKSRKLIKKLEALVSVHEGKQLQRQVVISGRIKTMNESIFYTVDDLNAAINADRQVTFQYYQWNVRKKQELRHEGKRYTVSPWALLWTDDNYYLIAYDAEAAMIKHYRVDKMLRLSVADKRREGKEAYKRLDMAKYSQSVFGMFQGEECSVTLLCRNDMAGVIIDRFGKDIPFTSCDEEHFTVRVTVAASQQFIGWVIGLGSGVKILEPESMVETMRDEIRRLSEEYTI